MLKEKLYVMIPACTSIGIISNTMLESITGREGNDKASL